MSFKKFLDPYRMRVEFPQLWARYLFDAFGGNPVLIALQFSVSEQTAYNWLKGQGRATGDKVAVAAAADPERFAAAMARAA